MREFFCRLFRWPVTVRGMQRVRLEKGDVLVLFVDRHITMDTAERLKGCARQVFGEDQKVVVLEDSIKMAVVAREAWQ